MDDIETKYKELVERLNKLSAAKMKIEAEAEARKRSLRTVMEECKKAGFDPDTLPEFIKKTEEVLEVKMSVFESDLKTAETQIEPFMKGMG